MYFINIIKSPKKIQQFNKVIIKMGVHIDVNKLVIIAEPKTIPFDLSEDVDNNFQHETDSIITHYEFYAIAVQIQTWKRYLWTRKTVKPMNHT